MKKRKAARHGSGKTATAGMYTRTARQGRMARAARRALRKPKHRMKEEQ